MIRGMNRKIFIFTANAIYFFVLVNFKSEMLHRAPVIFQGFSAGRFARGSRHRQIANFHPLRRGKKVHVGWVVKQRITEAAFVDHQWPQAGHLGVNRAGEPSRAGADANNIVGIAHVHSVRWPLEKFNFAAVCNLMIRE
jgi:hypothetical protein